MRSGGGLLEDYAGVVYLVAAATLRDPTFLPQYWSPPSS